MTPAEKVAESQFTRTPPCHCNASTFFDRLLVITVLKRIDMIKQTAFLPVRCMCEDGPCDDGYGGVACSVTVRFWSP